VRSGWQRCLTEGSQLWQDRVTINPASATNTVPSPSPADIASKGLAIISRKDKGCSSRATNNRVSQADIAAACTVHLGAQSSSDASAVFLIAIIREAKCHLV
jgi:hypothetical protein